MSANARFKGCCLVQVASLAILIGGPSTGAMMTPKPSDSAFQQPGATNVVNAGQSGAEQSGSGKTAGELAKEADDFEQKANQAAAKAQESEQKARGLGVFGAPLLARAKQWRDKERQYRQMAANLRAEANASPQEDGRHASATVVKNSDTPDGTSLSQILDHEWCSLKYPQDWKAYTSSISAVVLSPEPQPEDYTRMHARPPHYGVIIKAAHLGNLYNDLSESNFQALLLYLKTQHEGWGEPLSYSTKMSVNGRPARAAEVARSYVEGGQIVRQRAWIVAVQPPGTGLGRGNFFIFYAAFLAPEAEFQARKSLFEEIAATIVVKEIGAPANRRALR